MNEIDYLPISINARYKFENQRVSELLDPKEKGKPDRARLIELLRVCVLCHKSVQKTDKNKNEFSMKQQSSKKYKSIDRVDEAQLNFA